MPRTVIGPETRVGGALTGKDDLVIEGAVDGPIAGEAAVTLAAGARVGGEVRGRDVIVGGVLNQKVHASGTVRLLATAQVFADITTPRIVIDEGAVFEGQVRMIRAGAAAPRANPSDERRAPAASANVAYEIDERRPADEARAIPSLPPVGKKKLLRRTP